MGRSPIFRALGRALSQARAANLRDSGAAPPVSRRAFLKGSAAVGTLAFAGCLPGPRLTATPRVAVVGAGLAGLSAAYRLEKAGFACRVFEARARVGGRVATATADGLTLNMGGEFVNSDHLDMLALANELGIELIDRRDDTTDQPIPAVAYYFRGKSIAENELADALRPLAVAIGSDADRLDKDEERVAPELDRISVAEYLNRHAMELGEPYLRPLIETAIRSEYGVEPSESSALQLIALLPTVDGQRVDVLGASDEALVVKGGSARLAEMLASRLAGRVETGRRLQAIQMADDAYRLVFSPGASVDADWVILALPFPPLRRVSLDVELPAKLRRFIAETGPGANEKIIATFRRRAWRVPEGFTREAWTDLAFAEVWDSSSGQAERENGALTFFYGSHGTRDVAGAVPVDGLARYVPGLAAQATGRTLRTGWSADPLTGGAYTNLRPGQATEFAEYFWGDEREVRAGRILFAGEQTSESYYGYMNGAAETGRLAAAAVVRHVTGV